MDKPLIKGVLILAFVVALVFVFVGGYQALKQPTYSSFELPATTPTAPPPLSIQKIEDFSKPDVVAKQLEQMNLQIQAYAAAEKAYEANVAAYAKDIEARTTAWKAKNGDPAARLTAYEKVVKDMLGFYIVNPLLAALLIYSGIKVGGDVAKARATQAANAEVKSP
jgi:hypothetical protein